MNKILIIFVFIIINCKDSKPNGWVIKYELMYYESDNSYSYLISNDSINVIEYSFDGMVNSEKKLYSGLNRNKNNFFKLIPDLNNLDSLYIDTIIGGFQKKITVNYLKTIILDNKNIKEITKLELLINNIVPDNLQIDIK